MARSLRLVEKPAQSAARPEEQRKDLAAAAASRVAARFATMPAYGTLNAEADSPHEAMEQWRKAAGSLRQNSPTTAVHSPAGWEGRQTMNTSTMPITEGRDEPRALTARPIKMEVQLSIFEIDPDAEIAGLAAPGGNAALAEPAWEPRLAMEMAAVTDIDTSAEAASIKSLELAFTPRMIVAEAGPNARRVEAATMSRRWMAACFDLSLMALVVATVLFAMAHSYPALLRGGSALWLTVRSALACLLLYRVLFAVLLRVTPGQIFAEVRIVARDGQQASVARLALRQLLLPFSIVPFGLGLLWALFDGEGLGWHDRFSGTLPKDWY